MISAIDPRRTAAYLDRIGVARDEVTIDRDGLTLLHERHLRSIPFENLSIHLGEPIVLDVDALVDKLTLRRRGGFCYELNGAFAALLTTLGFDVELYEARVGPDGGSMRFDHLCLGVRDGDGWYLADVGFGASFLRPLDLRRSGPQDDPAGTYELTAVDGDDIDMSENGTVRFRFSTTPRALDDFAEACRYHQTSPESHFTQRTVCSLPTQDGRVTISRRTLMTTAGDQRTRRTIDSDDELLDLYRRHFGITLDRLPDDPVAAAPAERTQA